MEDRIVRLEERVERLQVDVTDMKTDIKRVDGKVDALRDSVTELQGEIKDGFLALTDRMIQSERARRLEFKAEMKEFRAELKADAQQLRTGLNTDMQQLRTDFQKGMEDLRKENKALFRAGVSACAFILVALAGGYVGLQAQLNKIIGEAPTPVVPAPAAKLPETTNATAPPKPAHR